MLKPNSAWPILRSYDNEHLARIAMPIGGIGTGCVYLGGRGDLRQFEVVNRPAQSFKPGNTFFALWTKPAGGEAMTRCLERQLLDHEFEGTHGSHTANHGLPRFQHSQFAAAYPLGQVMLSDPHCPLDVRLEAFNPFIPGDSQRSGMPVAVLRFVLSNRSSKPVDAAVAGSMQNFIGSDGVSDGKPANNINSWMNAGGLQGLYMQSNGVDHHDERWGTLALATTAKAGVTHRSHWPTGGWGNTLLHFWDDFSKAGKLTDCQPDPNDPAPIGSVAVRTRLAPKSERAITFILAWHFPNRTTWSPVQPTDAAASGDACCSDDAACCPPSTETATPVTLGVNTDSLSLDTPPHDPNWIGNYYATKYHGAWEAATTAGANLKSLETDTLAYVDAFCKADLPDVVKEAALFNTSTLNTQTVFRTPDGHMFGWEGLAAGVGCCDGTCTHVWNYEQATAFLFGDLSRSMRDVEFLHATDEQGLMSFRVHLPLASRAQRYRLAAADGQMGTLLKLYRDWRLCGDDDWLKRLWPKAKQSMAFCWIERGWDADQDGVMEGCQHNTMDVEYFGPNPQMQLYYLGALLACEAMANYVGDSEFADRCRGLYTKGAAWTDEHLFNGEYYEHHVKPQKREEVAEGLIIGMGAEGLDDPDFQLGPGCLIDQLVGQFLTHVCGLGHVVKPAHVRKSLQSIWKYNRLTSFNDHFNNMRSYVLNDESALLMASYPRGGRPKSPMPYFNEVMTGFEYTAAVGMIYEGQTDRGLQAITDIRARYDGKRRNPFDEAECGRHYARAMASWAAVLALTGFQYDATAGRMTFANVDKKTTWFWSTGDAFGDVTLKPAAKHTSCELRVLGGQVRINEVTLANGASGAPAKPGVFVASDTLTLKLRA